jgi:glucokinase
VDPAAAAIELPALARPCLVADIGGTHARFALSDAAARGTPRLSAERRYRAREFATLAEAIGRYLREVAAPLPERAVLAVAGAVTSDRVVLTNNAWNFSIEALRGALGFARLDVLNDFAAIAWAIGELGDDNVSPLGDPTLRDHGEPGVRVVLGPGTGLGLSAVKQIEGLTAVLDTEGGHISFAPRDDVELAVLKFLMGRYGRVSYERLLCGEGLLNLYHALGAIHGQDTRWTTPEEVSAAARAGDELARRATHAFCAVLGAFAGDAVLICGGWNGVYLSGDLLAHVLDDTGVALFRRAFEDKGRFAELLSRVPTLRITRSNVGNLGAATYARYLLERPSRS